MLANDPSHGDENKATMEGWLQEYTPAAVKAARHLQPIWSQLSEKVVRFEDSFERSRERFESFAGDIGIGIPEGVTP
jgi:propane monooxygenase small subunit